MVAAGQAGTPLVTGVGHVTPDQLAADRWAEGVRRESLERTRALAAQWATTVGVVFAILGIGTIIDSDDVVRALQPNWAVAYGLLAGAALVLAAASTLLASRGAQPRFSPVKPGADYRVRLREDLAQKARSDIYRSQVLFVIAILALVAAFGVRWYAPEKPKATEKATAAFDGTATAAIGEFASPDGRAVRGCVSVPQ
jgi:hypothetical protein